MTTITDADSWTTDFLAARPNDPGDAEAIQRREAQNVLSSYSRAIDFLSEALQNATDAIDMRSAREPDAPRRIGISFDRSQGRFSVADTGIGMSREDLEIVLTPNVTLKAGRLARSTTGRSRGHKGVGLSFLALGSNYLQIQTCDGRHRYDVVVRNGNRWIKSDEGTVAKPVAEGTRNPPDKHLRSTRYTIVTVGDLDAEDFDADLFGYEPEELVWDIRAKTAVGNTRPIFSEPYGVGLPPSEEVDVSLAYIDGRGKKQPVRPIPYRYASPEEIVPKRHIVDFSEISNITDAAELERRLRGAGLRYRRSFTSPSGRQIETYAFSMDAAEYERHAEAARKRGEYAPKEWQGFWVATRDMPANIDFQPRHIQPRPYERRMFALLQDDQLVLDLGRKTLVGRTMAMFRNVVKEAWQQDLVRYVPRLHGSIEVEGRTVTDAVLQARVVQAAKVEDLGASVPYLKQPQRAAGVMALFHEIVAADGLLPLLRTLVTGVFTDDRDALVYLGNPNGTPPMHVLFGHDLADIVTLLEQDNDVSGDSAGLAVVWDVDPAQLAGRGIEVSPAEGDERGATHILLMHRLYNLDRLPVIALKAVLESRT